MTRALGVASRVVAASLGGYALTYWATVSLAVMLPMRRAEAVLVASMLSFVVHIGAIVWAFAASTPTKAWLWLLGLTAVLIGIATPALWTPMGDLR